MAWQLIIAISVLLTATSTLVERVIMRESESQPVAYAILFEFVIGVFFGIASLFARDTALPALGPYLPNLALMIALYSVYSVATFYALRTVEIGRYILTFSLRALVTVLGGWALLHEGLGLLQLLGLVLIIGGITAVSLERGKLKLQRGDGWALLAAVSFGLANVNDRFLLHSFHVLPYLTIGFIGPALLLALLMPKELTHMRIFVRPRVLGRMLALCVIYAVSIGLFFAALQIAPNVSLVASLSLLSVIVTVLLGIVFLHERTKLPQKALGACLSFIGLLLVG